MSPKLKKLLNSAVLGVFMVVLFWLVYYLSLPILYYFTGDVSDAEFEVAATMRGAIYLTLVILSPQVWLFSTLYFFDRNRK